VVDFGQGLLVSTTGPGHVVCAGDTARDPSATAVPYGEDTQYDHFSCMSRTSGVTCTNQAKHGFFISIQSYRLF
jgi:hypothetical protein